MAALKKLIAQRLTRMKRLCMFVGCLVLIVSLTLLLSVYCSAGGNTQSEPVFGDYDAEPRVADHVDTDFLVRRLKELHANTYMWLIWHNTNDWDDLKVFLPKARQAGITVWVYLVPHSGTSLENSTFPYSEPFRLDYIRWAEEIARLSVQHTNLTGYVIDDFWANVCPERFSPDYIQRMVTAGKRINPKLRFYPLMYFNEITPQSVELLAPLVDGVVAAYPWDLQSVDKALTLLRGNYHVPGKTMIDYPWEMASKSGDHAFIVQRAKVKDPAHGRLSFRYSDDFDGPTSGYHHLQLRIDDQVVWEEDVEGHDDGVATVDLSKVLVGKKSVKLSLGVFDKRGVSTFAVQSSFSELSVRGLDLKDGNLAHKAAWSQDVEGGFSIGFKNDLIGTGKLHLPLIVMPAGDAWEYSHRYPGEEPTPERIASRVKSLVNLAKKKRIEGIVTYCLDKQEDSKSFEAVREIFREARMRSK
ncbi:MAG: hypothetical protein ACYC0V_13700 [Armatimonadota bacterium]